jgi:hypothetical protein
MNKLALTLLGGLAASLTAHAATVKQWDFNSVEFDELPSTGTLRPVGGIGYPAQPAGGLSIQFGEVAIAGGLTSDFNTLDNSHWRLGAVAGVGGFPTATNANKTAGAQFRVNTSGYQNIQVSWDQENSATASRYWRVQYTTNGTDWLDSPHVATANPIGFPDANTSTPTWQLGLTADLSAIPGASNNPDFGVRLVSEFEDTATGSGTNAYVANRLTSNYGTAGTLWVDMFTVTGDDLDPLNQWPTITAIADQSILMNSATDALSFDIFDAETAPESLVLSAHSSNPTLVNNFVFGGSGAQRTITAIPAANQTGTALITVRVQDAGNKITEATFRLSVFAQPFMSRIFPIVTDANTPAVSDFRVINLPGDPLTWVVSGTSSDQAKVVNANITFEGTDTNRTVTVTPQPGASGDVTITITATSGTDQASTNFLVRLAPAVIVEWNFSDLGATTTNLAPTTAAEGLDVAFLSRGPGLRAVGLGNGFGADRWNNANSTYEPSTPSRANAITRGDYFEFAVTVEAGKSLSLATIEASLRRSALNAALNFEWQYSLDGFATAGTTILPRGPAWTVLGLTNNNTFQYQGRTSGSPPAAVELYDWVIKDVPGRANLTTSPGDLIPTIDLSSVPGLQNIYGPTTVTFRLYGWGNASTADSNTSSLGRMNGPRLRGTIGIAPPSLSIELVGGDIRVLWPTSAAGYSLQSTTSLSPASWGAAGGTLTVEGDNNVVTLPATGTQFFRLQQ